MKIDPNARLYHQNSMTIRAEIASRIMSGLATHPRGSFSSSDEAAKVAVAGADALIKELNK